MFTNNWILDLTHIIFTCHCKLKESLTHCRLIKHIITLCFILTFRLFLLLQFNLGFLSFFYPAVNDLWANTYKPWWFWVFECSKVFELLWTVGWLVCILDLLINRQLLDWRAVSQRDLLEHHEFWVLWILFNLYWLTSYWCFVSGTYLRLTTFLVR